jgi:rhodanese-related sulfurtransferase
VTIPEVDIAAFADRHAGGATVIDVREPDEYVSGHVPGAVLIPLGEVPERVSEVPEGETVYLICRSGARSMRAGDVLAAEGRDVVNVAGGTMAWIEAGHPTITGDSPT